MALNKIILLFTFIIVAVLGYSESGLLKYSILDFANDKTITVEVSEDLVNNIVQVHTPNDTLEFFSVTNLIYGKVIFEKFLELKFRIRGGSGTLINKVVLISIKDKELKKSLELLTNMESKMDKVYDSDVDDLNIYDESEIYNLEVQMRRVQGDYFLNLVETYRLESKSSQFQNRSYSESFKLDFSMDKMCFFNGSRVYNDQISVFNREKNDLEMRALKGEFPVIQLYETKYILVEKRWYQDNGNGVLVCD